MNHRQLQIIEYLREENRVLREQVDERRFRLSDDQRRRLAAEIEQVVVQMAEQNRNWGYRQIQGALSNLGHKLARSTIADILERHGVEPAPERSRKTTWKDFLTQHWELIVAADFFTIGARVQSDVRRACGQAVHTAS